MAVSRLTQNTLQSGLPKFDTVWDGRSAVGSMEPISSITLTSAQSGIEFNNIPQTYTHLHIRFIGRGTRASVNSQPAFRFNSDTGSNYCDHSLLGSQASTFSGFDGPNGNQIWGSTIAGNDTPANTFGSGTVDILDYTNTNKYKVIRNFGGYDASGYGFVSFASGLWLSTSAITSIRIFEGYGNTLTQNSSFSLYGIR